MNKKVSLWVLICAVLFSAAVASLVTVSVQKDEARTRIVEIVSTEAQSREDDPISSKLKEIEATVKNGFLFEVDAEKAADEVASAYMYSLDDRYAAYFTKEEYDQITDSNRGNQQGIGVSVMSFDEEKALEIVNVTPGSPAEKAGLEIGDLIVKAGDEDVADLGFEGTVLKLRGESGTAARFTVSRKVDGVEKLIEFEIVREAFDAQTVLFEGLGNGIGYIRVTEFNGKTPEQFSSALESLVSDGCGKFVFDLRNNPGGMLSSITKILDKLLPEGPIIRMTDKDGNEETVDSDAEELDYPFAVIVNGDTASAAELFTSAMRDYSKAKIFGTTTYGKGSVQITVTLSDGSAVKYTHQLYSPPFSDNYDGKGIVPDVEVELPEELANQNLFRLRHEDDTQLKAAVDYLEQTSK